MHIFELWLFFFIISSTLHKSQHRIISEDLLSHEKYKRHTVSGRKGVFEPYPYLNISRFPVLTGIEFFRQLTKRSAHHHLHRSQIHSGLHHNRYQNITEKYQYPHKNVQKPKQNSTSQPSPKPKQNKKHSSWMNKVMRKFHLSKKIIDDEARKSWYLLRGNSKPFIADVDLCMLDQCYNKGTCISDPASPFGFRCLCPPGVIGDKCQTVIETCKLQPCQNGATCKPKHSAAQYRYFCICTPEYTGELCEVSIHHKTKPVPGSKSNDFFDRKRERNLRAENLIAVSVTVLILTIAFIILCFVFQVYKRKLPPPKNRRKLGCQDTPPVSPETSPGKSKPEFGPEEVYCPVITQVCRHCCAFFLEKKPHKEETHSHQRLTVVKKASSCGQLTTSNLAEMPEVKPRLASSQPTVKFPSLTAMRSLDEIISEEERKREERKKLLAKESKEWLMERIRTGIEDDPHGMARVQPTKIDVDDDANADADDAGEDKAETDRDDPEGKGDDLDDTPQKTEDSEPKVPSGENTDTELNEKDDSI